MIKNKNSRRPRTLAGFTLLEMIVVIAIIGVLGSIIVPSTVSSIRDSKIETANSMAYEYYSAVQNYLTDVQIKDVTLLGVATASDLESVLPPIKKNSGCKTQTGKLVMCVREGRNGDGISEMTLYSGSSVLKSNKNIHQFSSSALVDENNKKKVKRFVNGVYKYVGVTDTKYPAYWVAQIDTETYTVDWVVYCDQQDAEQSINTLLNNYNGTQLYQAVFGKSTGTNTSQEYDAMHAGGSEKTPAYVGQYPIPYKN